MVPVGYERMSRMVWQGKIIRQGSLRRLSWVESERKRSRESLWMAGSSSDSLCGNLTLLKSYASLYSFQWCTSSSERDWPTLDTPPGLSFHNCKIEKMFTKMLSRLGTRSLLDTQKLLSPTHCEAVTRWFLQYFIEWHCIRWAFWLTAFPDMTDAWALQTDRCWFPIVGPVVACPGWRPFAWDAVACIQVRNCEGITGH